MSFGTRVFLSVVTEITTRVVIPGIAILYALYGPTNYLWQQRYADTDPERAVFGPLGCDRKCIVTLSLGGYIRAFVNTAVVLIIEDKQLIIDGRCVSACAIMADFARPNTCITRRATFEFHMAYTWVEGSNVKIYKKPPISNDIHAWVNKRGGFPHDDLLVMDFEEARRFWPVCQN